MKPRAALLKRAQIAVLVLLVAWVAVHSVLVWQTGLISWDLGGFGMYAEPAHHYRAASVVICGEERCADERADVRYFMPFNASRVPLLKPKRSGNARYVLVSNRPVSGELIVPLTAFLRWPIPRYAEGLVRARVSMPCGPYLVVFYEQRLSMISRRATVEPRPVVVSMRC